MIFEAIEKVESTKITKLHFLFLHDQKPVFTHLSRNGIKALFGAILTYLQNTGGKR